MGYAIARYEIFFEVANFFAFKTAVYGLEVKSKSGIFLHLLM